MKLTSKFDDFYLLRLVILPILFTGLSIWLYNLNRPNINSINGAYFFLILAFLILIYNLATIFQIEIEETEIIKVSFLTRKKKVIPYSTIKSSKLDYTSGGETDAGTINPGYYKCVFILENDEKLIISPVYFENYKELIRAISHNRNT